MERYTPLAAEFGPEGKLWGINKSSVAAIGRWARSAPFGVANEIKMTGARSARARTRGQNPLVYHIFI
jgi:hypothetical protein